MNEMTSINGEFVPHSIEAEQQILAAIMTDNELFYKVSGFLSAEHFYEPLHARIWKQSASRISKDHLVSPVTLKSDFEADEGLKEVGGPAYLARLMGAAIAPHSSIADYATMVVELANERRVYQMFKDGMDAIRSRSPLSEVKSTVELALSEVSAEAGQADSVSLIAAFTQAITNMNKAFSESRPMGLQTGIGVLDARLGGLFAPDLIVIAGRPSMGKTSLATSLALRAARQGVGVGVVSREMSEEGLAHRILSELSGVPYFEYRKAHEMSPENFRKTVEASKNGIDLPIEIVPPHIRDIGAIYSSAKKIDRKFKSVGGLGLLVVDYLQIVGGKGNSRHEEIANVSVGLKNLAKMLNCPVVALSQLSRGVEMRENKRPVLPDLRESGQIEQDADVVLFTYRDSYYLERQTAETDMEKRNAQLDAIERSKNVMEIITAKQRFGPIGTDKIGFAIETNRFWDLSPEPSTADMGF